MNVGFCRFLRHLFEEFYCSKNAQKERKERRRRHFEYKHTGLCGVLRHAMRVCDFLWTDLVLAMLYCTVLSHGPMRNIGFLGRWGTCACPQCLPSDTVPIRSWTWTLRRPDIRHRQLPYHAILYQTTTQPGNRSPPPGTVARTALQRSSSLLLGSKYVCGYSWTSTILAVGITPTIDHGWFFKRSPRFCTNGIYFKRPVYF